MVLHTNGTLSAIWPLGEVRDRDQFVAAAELKSLLQTNKTPKYSKSLDVMCC